MSESHSKDRASLHKAWYWATGIAGLLLLGMLDGLSKVAVSGTDDDVRRVGMEALGATALFVVLVLAAVHKRRNGVRDET